MSGFKDEVYGHFARIGKALASPKRLEILDLLAQGEKTVEAVAAPRYHQQWEPAQVFAEPMLPEALVAGLRERGHDVAVDERPWSSAQAIVIDPTTGLHLGGSDPRGDGVAVGYNP